MTTTRRADAHRNRELILDRALVLLAADPDASIQAIADATQLTRTTVYRHFPTRESLTMAVAQRAGAGVEPLMARVDDPAISLAEALDVLVGFAIGAAVEHRGLIDPATIDAAGQAAVAHEPMVPILERRRDRGEVRADLPVTWLAAVVRAVVVAGVKTLADPHEDPDAVRASVRTTLLDALAARPADG